MNEGGRRGTLESPATAPISPNVPFPEEVHTMCTDPSNERHPQHPPRAGTAGRKARKRPCLTERELAAYLAARETVRRIQRRALDGAPSRFPN